MPRSVTKNRSNRNYRKRTQRRKIRGGDGERILIDTLCNQASDQTLEKVPEIKGIVKGICDKSTLDNTKNNDSSNSGNNNSNNASNSNSLLDAAGGFFDSSGASGMASKAIKGFGNVATLPMRIAFGALEKITGYNPFDSDKNQNQNQNQNSENDDHKGGNVSKLIEKLNTVDKRYLGPEIVEELNNFSKNQSGGRRSRKTQKRRKRKNQLRKRKNKKSLKKKNRK
jgi:hypothetical protein